MIAKHGSEGAVREFMRQNQQKSMLNPNRQKGRHRGGFKALEEEDPGRLEQISRNGAKALIEGLGSPEEVKRYFTELSKKGLEARSRNQH